MTDRKQRVVLGETVSDWLDVLSGVPQGSVLGPLLFVIFINDLPGVVASLCRLFADDTKLIGIIKNPSDLAIMQDGVNELVKWSNDWLMCFNEDKCVYMAVNNKSFVIDLKMNGKSMRESTQERDLGIQICSNLKWNAQVNVAANKAMVALYQLKKTFKFWTVNTFKRLYSVFIRPHLEYAVAAWCPYNKKDIDTLEKVQRRAIKLVKSIKNLSYEERLLKLGLMSLKERRVRGDLIEFFKINKGLSSVDWFHPNKKCYSLDVGEPASNIRGHKHRLVKQHTRIRQREYFFSNRVVDNWNRLPPNVILAENINQFKNRYDEFKHAEH